MEWTREREECEALVEPVAQPAAARSAKEKERWQDREARQGQVRQGRRGILSLLRIAAALFVFFEQRCFLQRGFSFEEGNEGVAGIQILSDLLGTDPLEDVRQEQRTLNLKKKLLAKMDKLKAKHTEKREAWNKFLDALEEHRKKEKAKHHEDLQSLNEQMTEVQKEINQILIGESGADKDASMAGVEETEKEMLRRQLEKSNAMIQDLQARVETYVGALPSRPDLPNENSPQLTKLPSLGLVEFDSSLAARTARAKALEAARHQVEPPEAVRSRSASRSPRRDGSNSLERFD